ncbi:MAG TPA: pyrroline-5-carboxylate reductase [Cyclobacteriaceae bacterium]|nr:pyrroline-5-carboxylate reductase [Cyclobacteriaceae bacterium]HMV08714.1 pyrroline-5-carboxylate reductase [Cyclobacteriaceae bacterium]HMV90050.1 pyrroline-5-carboxylate reductase [Cyclobacteriaceae bacterium]HMW99859.1 pyrroline-5-carboxylate reductase [Cyclobacteriaceae bacterium]HMX49278.1 pyrroline-5-carboxylate reductase [Cyclobacteriaceae bacterium]
MAAKKIAILGGGNLGVAIAKGIANSGQAQASDIIITRRNLSKITALKREKFVLSSDNVAAVKASAVVLLCVQPKQLAGLLEEISSALSGKKHILVSTITGITTEEISGHLNKQVPIVRAMPNTAIAIGASMTCICSKDTSDKQLREIENLFKALGQTLIIEEHLMKAATVLAASGIAFFMRYLRAATQGGIQLGFDAEESQMIAAQTAKGAALLLAANHSHPELEIDKVTTPQGCTIAGLNEMEHQGLSSALIKGIVASFEKINSIKK